MKRKQYNQLMTELNEKLADVRAKLEEADKTDGASLENIEDWNDLHTLEWEIEQDIKSLERSWETRNWSTSDWNRNNLIINNVD